MSLLPALPAGPPNVILSEPTRDSVLAAVALARRLPGGSAVTFASRESPHEALTRPAHLGRSGPYRLYVIGPDLAPGRRDEILQTLRQDPARSKAWIDANEWLPEDARAVGELTEGRHWSVPSTHHPFPALTAAADPLGLLPDPFGEKLLALAERRLAPQDEEQWGGPWRDALDALEGKSLELAESVRPLLHGLPQGLGVVDRGEGEALRREVGRLVEESSLIRVSAGDHSAVLLILPRPGKVSPLALAEQAMLRSQTDLALVLYDKGDRALLIGRRRGQEPPVDVRPLAARLLGKVPFCRRERLGAGEATLSLVEPPIDRLERLVAALTV